MLFLDTEFTRFRGELISLALVSDQGGGEFYGVLHIGDDDIDPWAIENVVPVLGRTPETYEDFQYRLAHFLNHHHDEPILADWPEDLAHLLNCLVPPQGQQFNVGDWELRLVKSGELKSEVPHNALHDARALAAWYASLEVAA